MTRTGPLLTCSLKRPILLFFLIPFCLVLNSQIKISQPEVSFLDNILTIKYDITGCGTGNFINIKLIILNSRGDTIRPTYITGDLGSRVTCGFGKKIEWNVVKDSVLIDEDVEVQLTGKQESPEVPVYIPPPVEKVSRGKVMLASVFVPGLGQKMASGKGAHLITSGFVYGGLGAAVFFKLKSDKYYDDYNSATGTLRDEYYDKSIKAYNNSLYSLIGGAGIWTVNFIWSAVIPIKENSRKMKVSFNTLPRNGFVISAGWTF